MLYCFCTLKQFFLEKILRNIAKKCYNLFKDFKVENQMIHKHITEQTAILFSVTKWVFLSSMIGIIIGATVTGFLKILAYSETSRSLLPFEYYYTLPFALVLTVWLVKTFAPSAEGHGTEKVISAVHKDDGKINVSVIPVKTLTTILTIFAGGSVGK